MQTELTFPSFSLAGKKALVTGASRGIGRALALGLANAGADVAVAARSVGDLESVAEEILSFGRQACVIEMDMRDVDAIRRGVVSAAEGLGGLDCLINNAGYNKASDALETTEENWDAVIDTNLKGVFFCAQAAAKLMAYAEGGAIVNIGSVTSGVGIPTATPYGATKTGVIGLTRSLATEWARFGIRVNAICPGWYRTNLTKGHFDEKNWHESTKAKIPMRRFGELGDLIGTAVFYCSDASAYVTGTDIYVDGGFMASV